MLKKFNFLKVITLIPEIRIAQKLAGDAALQLPKLAGWGIPLGLLGKYNATNLCLRLILYTRQFPMCNPLF
jgi:hypothetical protein